MIEIMVTTKYEYAYIGYMYTGLGCLQGPRYDPMDGGGRTASGTAVESRVRDEDRAVTEDAQAESNARL